jgi:hypothetical protein
MKAWRFARGRFAKHLCRRATARTGLCQGSVTTAVERETASTLSVATSTVVNKGSGWWKRCTSSGRWLQASARTFTLPGYRPSVTGRCQGVLQDVRHKRILAQSAPFVHPVPWAPGTTVRSVTRRQDTKVQLQLQLRRAKGCSEPVSPCPVKRRKCCPEQKAGLSSENRPQIFSLSVPTRVMAWSIVRGVGTAELPLAALQVKIGSRHIYHRICSVEHEQNHNPHIFSHRQPPIPSHAHSLRVYNWITA